MWIYLKATGILRSTKHGNVLIENETIPVEIKNNRIVSVGSMTLEDNEILTPESFFIFGVNRLKPSDLIFEKPLKFFFHVSENLWMISYLLNWVESVSNTKEADVVWKTVKTYDASTKILKSLLPHQHINTLFHHDMLCQKRKLAQIITGTYMPSTWFITDVIPNELVSLCREEPDMKVICKPESLSEGRGIMTGTLMETITKITHKKLKNRIIQLYIETPLIEERKFDIRMYGFIHSSGVHYLSRNGFLRLAAKKYNSQSNDRRVHLTNTSIAKCQSLIRDIQTWEYFGKVFPIMQNIFSDVVHQFINHPQFTFERQGFIYVGLDFILDREWNVYLLEMNRKPSTVPKSFLQNTIKRSMASDLVGFLGYILKESNAMPRASLKNL